MDQLILIGVDLAAILILTFGLYFPRHRRRDLVAAFLVANAAVLSLTYVLASTTIGLGLGLGLFGVLSIIRLRSRELSQTEVAYYLAALALGLVAGMSATADVLSIGLTAVILAALFVGDHPALFRRYRAQTLVLDRAITDETELAAEAARRLGATVRGITPLAVDLVEDTTTLEVRYEVPRPGLARPEATWRSTDAVAASPEQAVLR